MSPLWIKRATLAALVSPTLASTGLAQGFAAPATSMGPAPITDTINNGNGVNLPSGNSAGGAVTTVVTDAANPSTLVLGTANGGVWRSTNGGTSFVPVTDRQSSLSIGALAIDPTSPADARVLVAGFGNFSNAASAGGARNGLIISRDGGLSWNPLASVGLRGIDIGGVVASGATILAASPDPNGGVFLSTTFGASFSRVGGLVGGATGLVADPSRSGRLYAAIVPPNDPSQAQVVMSVNNGVSWRTVFTASQAAGTIGANTSVLRIAVGPTGALAVAVVNNTENPAGAQPRGLFLSATPSAADPRFASLALPRAVTSDGLVFGLNPGGQAISNFAIAIDPTNPNTIFVSGDRVALEAAGETQDPSATRGQNPDSLGASQYTATVFKVALQADGSSVFQAITDNGTANGSAPHADTRSIAFNAAGTLLLGTDGGLYTRDQPSSGAGGWDSLNGGLGALEVYKGAYDPLSGRVFVAAQDNGVSGQSQPGGPLYSNISTGDGFNAAVDAATLAAQQRSIAYIGSNSLTIQRLVFPASGIPERADALAFTVRGADGAAAALNVNEGTSDLPLAAQFVLNRADPRLVALGTLRVYTATLDPALFTGESGVVNVNATDLVGANLGTVTALAYGARDNPGALLAAVANTILVSTAATPAPGTLQPTAGQVNGYVNSLVFDPDNSRQFFVTNGATVMRTQDSGDTFTDLRGNLPASFQNVNAAEFISDNGVRALFAGGSNAVANAQSPVYVALDGALSAWVPFSTGLPNALVNQLTYTPQADLLLVSTLGRGEWAINDVTSYFPMASRLQFGFAGNDSAPGASQLTDGTDYAGRGFSRGLVKQGGGTLSIGVPATYTGPTTISAGTLRATAANVLAPASDHNVAQGAMLDLGGFDQTIGSLAGAGQVALGAGTLTTGGSGATTRFNGAIGGAGGLVKEGAGVFTLGGANTYTGGTLVDAGTLALPAATTLAGGVIVAAGATLSTAPGAAGPAPVRLASLTTQPGSLLRITPTPGARPAIASSGPVSLSGTVEVDPTADQEVPGTVLPLITGSTVTDHRALVVTGAGPLRAVADPSQGGFAVMLVRGERDLASGSLQSAVASAIDADVLGAGRDAKLELSVAADTVGNQGRDLRMLSGIGLAGFETAAVAGAQRFQTNIAAHIAGLDDAAPATAARQVALAAGAVRSGAGRAGAMGGALDPALLMAASLVAPEAADPGAHGQLWIEGSGAWTNLAARGDAPSIHAASGGVVIGAETALRPGILVGLAAGYDSTAIGSEGLTAASHVDAFRLSAYGRVSLGDAAPWLGGSIDYARSIGRGGRALALGLEGPDPLFGSTTAKPDGNTIGGQAQLGQHFGLGGFDVLPTAAVQVLHYEQDAFLEGGATGAELAVGGRSRTGARTVLGAAIIRDFGVGGGMRLTPAVSLGWAHEFADRGAVLNASFLAGGSAFQLAAAAPGRDAALIGASATLRAGPGLAVYVGYDAALARRETVQGVTGGLRVTW